jgi:hypothetical protein
LVIISNRRANDAANLFPSTEGLGRTIRRQSGAVCRTDGGGDFSDRRREAAERNSPAQRKIGGIDFPAGWVGIAGKTSALCKSNGNFRHCPYRARIFVGDFLPSALRWAVTRRPCGATLPE